MMYNQDKDVHYILSLQRKEQLFYLLVYHIQG